MTSFIVLSMIGGSEWLLIFIVVVLLFGGKKIPELMKGLGEGIREFKKASKVEDEKSDKPLTEGK
ncbi:MAG TPA: twin-arginine translocase TatA/TatE family subunit [Bacteroidales bacterium]